MHVLVLGSGQLARMMALAGAPLNITIHAYDVGTKAIVDPISKAQIENASLESELKRADVVTAEFEHIPHDILDVCEQSGKLKPSAQAIKVGGDRRLEKRLLDQAGVKNAPYRHIETFADLELAIESLGLPLVLKSALGGYDGKGQWRIKNAQQAQQFWPEVQACLDSASHQAIVAEQWIPFQREVSLVGVRRENGDIATYPLAENIHVNGVLSLSSAIDDPQRQAQAHAMFSAVADTLDYCGVLALEFFDVDGQLLVNEIAPRVHNSGHWTQQGSEVCQFENHLRAVCNLPLGNTELLRPTTMINILGEDSIHDMVLAKPGCHLHWYGKQKRAGRKMGHLNVSAQSEREKQQLLTDLTDLLPEKLYPALHQWCASLTDQ
ncbi:MULTISPECIES: 5-(carboxyamino)imidazole ribonucleotide synthase [unclassified Vibrio]|uniref:N5-carboxyaminoimidazole ribonucleotide synthase n=1 Tax=Vibrio sp. HB236076 TaxID=3232307 RepID=A0AB39HAL2_9VIBR|nr:5-(carboxyamino)imidazole ribonucleotide synthase [Vibrio sp. HB161653]MDP5255641.1 5-(carboxyamino)imidazole ribonucleotide synthase [Vibrio sp. HB161653]